MQKAILKHLLSTSYHRDSELYEKNNLKNLEDKSDYRDIFLIQVRPTGSQRNKNKKYLSTQGC